MKKIGRIAIAMVALAAGTAFVSSNANAATPGSGSFGECHLIGKPGQFHLKTVTPDILTIKADLPSAGWWNGDTISQINSGYEYCLASEIAYLSGLKKISLHNVSFDKLVSGTLTGYDMSLDEISITPSRAKVVSFSDPYYNSYIGVMVRSGANVTAANIQDKTLGVKEGTTAAQWAETVLKPKKEIKVYPGDAEALAAVVSGQIDAYLQDAAIELGQAKQSGGQVEVVGRYETDQSYGIMFPKDSPNIATVNKILAWCKAHGYMKYLSTTYLGPAFGGDPEKIPVWTAK
ncbi:ABC transporter substrate-binding protein [Acidocella aminolytica]|jgi:polar amino acid transport system substrate-binding protein|uniref:Extracellular solute-binding protein family 3 n=1 Tax=Acidocella aminolytica 101 = DSM 11237 TaxID=1120923 RepID=A0A0D6PHA4_9PROT|nr:ABC transporter substrate-binding protein [Acidocella aminolytica]GAN81057.1 extracellular solute-binding protein family 3 [Acidocella aminolytica 101 = DSM 11237]GBQ42791.1 amino acid ABC transporter substrate-binding periplasmic protein [Acidocella aminolytica 101 = DSM 11237]SHF18478.1 polar amino acid transport system substrate-binding protein [Acidocella aminolytica 101 = DSM 11237]